MLAPGESFIIELNHAWWSIVHGTTRAIQVDEPKVQGWNGEIASATLIICQEHAVAAGCNLAREVLVQL
jgi:hypothetical protein